MKSYVGKQIIFFHLLILLCSSLQVYGVGESSPVKKASVFRRFGNAIVKVVNAPGNAFKWTTNKIIPNEPRGLVPSLLYTGLKIFIPVLGIIFSRQLGEKILEGYELVNENYPSLGLVTYHTGRAIEESSLSGFIPVIRTFNPLTNSPGFDWVKKKAIKTTGQAFKYIPFLQRFVRVPDGVFQNLTPIGLGVNSGALYFLYKNFSNPDDKRGIKGWILDSLGRFGGSAGEHLFRSKPVINTLQNVATTSLSSYTADQKNMEKLKEMLSGVFESDVVLNQLKKVIKDPVTSEMLGNAAKGALTPSWFKSLQPTPQPLPTPPTTQPSALPQSSGVPSTTQTLPVVPQTTQPIVPQQGSSVQVPSTSVAPVNSVLPQPQKTVESKPKWWQWRPFGAQPQTPIKPVGPDLGAQTEQERRDWEDVENNE